jgi:hypothetical protein
MIDMKLVRHWIPFAFCWFLVHPFFGNGPGPTGNWMGIAIWLPMCFFFVGAVTYLMQKQIQSLQAEVQELKKLQQQ